MPVTLWMKRDCPHCDELRRDLAARGEVVAEIDIERNPHLIPELMKLTGRRRVVPVLVSGTRVEVAPRGGSTF